MKKKLFELEEKTTKATARNKNENNRIIEKLFHNAHSTNR